MLRSSTFGKRSSLWLYLYVFFTWISVSNETARRDVPMQLCTTANRMFKCKDTKVCLELFEVCNNYADCFDKSDEGGQCADKEMCNNHCTGAKEECFRSPGGPICSCTPGFKMKNGRCEDVDECQIYGTCDQRCMNTPGSFSCTCDPGYLLQKDGHTCKAADGEGLLVFATPTKVRARYLVSQNQWTVTEGQSQVVGVAYDGHHIYWTEIVKGRESIIRANEDGSNAEAIVTSGLGQAEDLAIDWITKNIYFSDSELKRICVCDHDVTACAILHDDEDKPRGIALLPEESMMYWSDWGENPKISRSGMDGSGEHIFVNESLHWPNGVVIDYPNSRLYWVDAKLGRIESIALDGSDRRKVLEERTMSPFAIDVFEDSIYWSDWKSKSIKTCKKFTCNDRRVLFTESKDQIYGIHVFHPSTQNTEIKNPCTNSLCSDLCLLSPNKGGYQCACQEGKMLKRKNVCVSPNERDSIILASSDVMFMFNHKQLGRESISEIGVKSIGKLGAITYNPITDSLLMSDTVNREIVSIHLHTKSLSKVITGIGVVQGLSLDYYGHNLYFTDSESASIKVVSLTNGHCKTLFNHLLDTPKDVVVIPEEGVLFVSLLDSDGKSHIDRFSMTGRLESRIHVIESGLSGLFLPLHYNRLANRLFWGNSHNIENIDVDEAINRQMFWPSASPVSITSIGNDIFWTESNPQFLYYVDMSQANTRANILDLGENDSSEPFLLTTITQKISEVNHRCQIDNGNCSFICLPEKINKVCACPDGMILTTDGLGCTPVHRCGISEFQCDLSSVAGATKLCIPMSSRCDGLKDCPNGEDEDYCVHNSVINCLHGQFGCHDGSKCIDRDKICDSVSDCNDNSDEIDCHVFDKCDDEDHFKCKSGECINAIARCNYKNDCDDKSDEAGCVNATCNEQTQFRCNSGTCIPASWHCNSDKDCPDGSDEDTCDLKKTCNTDQFTCKNRQCIDKILRCDGGNDCEDVSDEVDCKSKIFTITYPSLHDGHNERVVCDEHVEFKCNLSSGKCVPKSARCNGTQECPGGEDEDGCRACNEDDFRCDNGKCIPKLWVCDKQDDCGDKSDEEHKCLEGLIPAKPVEDTCIGFRCANKNCIQTKDVCNVVNDCGDGSDEGGRCGSGCKNAGCDHKCKEMPAGPKCDCEDGYALMGDARTCSDIDECLSGRTCSQYCKNTIGGFHCSCKYPEYVLRNDGKSCKAKGREMEYLFAYKNQIRTMWKSHSHIGLVYFDKAFDFQLSSLSVDVHRKFVYWTKETSNGIYRMSMVDRNILQNMTVAQPSKMSIDWKTGNIYVVEDGYKITVCNFELYVCAAIYSTEQTLRIDALKVDPVTRYMFWSERSQGNQPFSKIYRSDMSGSKVVAIVTKELHTIADIHIDFFHSNIFWAESTMGHIEKATFNGTNRQVVLDVDYRMIDFTIFEDHAYLLVKSNNMLQQHQLEKTGNIRKCGLYGAALYTCELLRITPSNFELPYHFQIMHEALQPKGYNICKNSNCSDLCVLSINGPACICENGMWEKDGKICPKNSGTSRKAYGVNTFGLGTKGISDDNSRSSIKTIWIANTIMFAIITTVLMASIYYCRSRLFDRHVRALFDRKMTSGESNQFENNLNGLTNLVTYSHRERNDSILKPGGSILKPGENHYENPLSIEPKDKSFESIELNMNDTRTHKDWSNSLGPAKHDGSDASSNEYSEIQLNQYKVPPS